MYNEHSIIAYKQSVSLLIYKQFQDFASNCSATMNLCQSDELLQAISKRQDYNDNTAVNTYSIIQTHL